MASSIRLGVEKAMKEKCGYKGATTLLDWTQGLDFRGAGFVYITIDLPF